MIRSRRSVRAATAAALAAAPLLAAVPAAAAGAHPATAAKSNRPSTTLKQVEGPTGVLQGLSRATRVGATDPSRVLTVGVGIQLPQLAAEQALAKAQQDPTSASYHQWLSPAEFAQRFGVDDATKQATVAWLTGGGLTIQTTSPVGDYYTATGTAAQIDDLFKVSEGDYTYTDPKLGPMAFYANDVAPSAPDNIPVAQIAGLDDVKKFSSSHVAGSYDTPFAKSAPAVAGVSTFTQGITPGQLSSIYNLPSTDLGQGATAGLFGEGESDSVINDMRLFEAYYGFQKMPVRVVRPEGGTDQDYGDEAGSVEWNLDTQAINGMAPKLSELDMYFAKTLYDPDIFADFSSWANDPNGPTQMNASFGECEAAPGNQVTGPLAQIPYGTETGDELEPVAEAVLLQANLEGRGLFASAGDTGSGCPMVVVPVLGAGNGVGDQPAPDPNYPCASQYVTCVGGSVISYTTSATTGAVTRTDERNWGNTGGGPSHFIPRPDFQKNVTANNALCVGDPTGGSGSNQSSSTGKPCRGAPDVAALSGNILGNGYELFADGGEITTGGTSLSSPLWVGMWSRVSAAQNPTRTNGKLAAGTTGGFGAASLYTLYGTTGSDNASYAKSFFDITCGEYDTCAAGTPVGGGNGAYRAATGWDYVSGLGSPNLTGIMTALGVPLTPYAGATSAPEAAVVPYKTSYVYSPSLNAGNPAVADPTKQLPASASNIGQADLLSSTMTTSSDGKTITIAMTGTQFDGSVPAGATAVDYIASWQYTTPAVTTTNPATGAVTVVTPAVTRDYYVKDTVDQSGGTVTTGTQSAQDGTAPFKGTDNTTTRATAVFANDVLTFTVPASEVGSPALGGYLTYPQAETAYEAAIPFTADRAAAQGSSVASVGQAVCVGGCGLTDAAPAPAVLPEVPTAVLLPLVALAVLTAAGGLVLIRRRRGVVAL